MILLFSVAAAVAIAVRQLHVPYTVALVLTGLALGILHLFTPPHLTKELLFSVFLPGLLFEAAFHIEFREFWRNRLAIASLAVPGVAAAVALTTVILTPVVNTLHLEQDFTWQYALVFGALIAATDPIAVVAVFRSLGAPRRLSVLLDGESLLNDGTAIVFFTLSLSLVTGASVTAGQLATDFFKIVGFGGLIGAAVGLAVSQVIKQIDDAMIEITLTTIAAYGSFVTAEHFHYSGVIAVVVAGVLCGNYGARIGMTPSTRVAVETFWEYVAFALELDCVPAHRPGSASRCVVRFVEGDSRRVSGRDRGPGAGDLRGVRFAAKDARENSVAVERRADVGRVARRLADGAGAQSGEGFSASGSVGDDDVRGGDDLDSGAWHDHLAPAALAGHRQRAASTGKRTSSPAANCRRPARRSKNWSACRTCISPATTCAPSSRMNTKSGSRRSKTRSASWNSTARRLRPRNPSGRAGICC